MLRVNKYVSKYMRTKCALGILNIQTDEPDSLMARALKRVVNCHRTKL